MSTSQNGWPVDRSGASQDRGPLVRDITVPNGVLAGDVAVVFRWLARQFDARVEQLMKGSCWGWFVKPIEGSQTISNHASGTAVDLNADKHPMGVSASKTFTTGQIAACHAILAEADGVLRWGGDYTGRPDPMHWEIVGSAAQVRALANKIGSGEDGSDMLVSEGDSSDQVRFWQYVLTELGFGPGDIDGDYGPKTEAAVNAYRASKKVGASTSINSWTAFVLLRDLAVHSAGGKTGPQGPAGPAGPKGDPGPAGPAGQLTGTFTVTGGQLSARADS